MAPDPGRVEFSRGVLGVKMNSDAAGAPNQNALILGGAPCSFHNT